MRKAVVHSLCSNCEKETEMEVLVKNDVITVRKEPIEVEVEYCRCKECGDEVLDPNLNRDPFVSAYRVYRSKHGLLQPEEIREWRKSLGLTQRELAKLLGVGLATVSRYENGSLQDESHDRLLRLAMEPGNLLKLVKKSDGIPDERERKRLLDLLRDEEVRAHSLDETIIMNLANYDPSEFSGYRNLDLDKLYSAILFFCKSGVFKTKLNKLLFYADFRHFKEYALSITGARYAHVPFGPAPDDYEIYYASLRSQGGIEFVEWEGGYAIGDETPAGEILQANREPDLSQFSPSELRVMASVMEDFSSLSAKGTTELSHEEVGYEETRNGEIISYSYANELKH